MGGDGHPPTSGAEEEERGDPNEENFRRLFKAIDFDPSRVPPCPALNREKSAGPSGWGGWLAASLNLRSPRVSY